jgi:hypothetical protein
MKDKPKPMPSSEFTAICRGAKSHFRFLADYGMTLAVERLPTTDCFKDGFRLDYSGNPISVRVEYYDCEYVILFTRGTETIPYLFIDHHLFGNRSGYAGNMFGREKLQHVILKTSADVASNYQAILKGDDAVWKKITALYHAPTERRRLP